MTNDSARLLSGVVYGGGSEQLDEKNHKLHRCFSSCINFFGGLIKVIEDAFFAWYRMDGSKGTEN